MVDSVCTLGRSASARSCAALLVVGAVQAHHERHLGLDLVERLDQALGHLVAAGDAAEDVEQHRGDAVVGEDDLHGLGDRLGLGAAAGVEEVGGPAARLGHDVERGHHQAGAVAQDADVAVERHVGEAALAGHRLLRVHALLGAELGGVGVAVQRAGVDRDLGVERHHLARLGHEQRVDLHEHRVLGHEGLVEPAPAARPRGGSRRRRCRPRRPAGGPGSPGSPAAGPRGASASPRGPRRRSPPRPSRPSSRASPSASWRCGRTRRRRSTPRRSPRPPPRTARAR